MSEAQLAGMRRLGRPSLGELPRKAVSIRLDQHVLEWVKRRAATRQQPYQTLINEILEKAMRRAG
jgi:predicted DNA binding CopG/RHH family protein